MGNVTITLSGDDSKLIAALNRVIRKEDELGRAATKAGKSTKRATDGSTKSLGVMDGVLDGVAAKFGPAGAIALGTAAMAKGFQVALDIIERMNQETDRLVQKQASAAAEFRSLAQLGGGDPGKVRELTAQSREFLAAGGAKNQAQATATIFALESASINTAENRKAFASLGGTIGDPAGFAKSARTLQASIGQEETGTVGDILSKAFAASAETSTTAPELLGAAAKAGAFASNLGISDEELLAAVSIASEKAGGAAEGGTNVRAFLKNIANDPEAARAAREGGITGAIENIQSRGLTGSVEFGEAFGKRAETFQGFTQLASGDLEGLTERVDIAQEEGLATSIAKSADADASVRFARATRISKERGDLASAEPTLKRQFADLIAARHRERLIGRGEFEEVATRESFREFQRSGIGRILSAPAGAGTVEEGEIITGIGRGLVTEEEQAAFAKDIQVAQLRQLEGQLSAIQRMSSDRIPHSDSQGLNARNER